MSLRQIDWTNWRLVEYHKGVAVRWHEFVKNFEKGTDIYKLITDTERLRKKIIIVLNRLSKQLFSVVRITFLFEVMMTVANLI
jgi:aspartate/tyrosine/aromatic aminotransferase